MHMSVGGFSLLQRANHPRNAEVEGEAILPLDVILLITLLALAIWTEVDKLRKPRQSESTPLPD
jgi:hypothetical protein